MKKIFYVLSFLVYLLLAWNLSIDIQGQMEEEDGIVIGSYSPVKKITLNNGQTLTTITIARPFKVVQKNDINYHISRQDTIIEYLKGFTDYVCEVREDGTFWENFKELKDSIVVKNIDLKQKFKKTKKHTKVILGKTYNIPEQVEIRKNGKHLMTVTHGGSQSWTWQPDETDGIDNYIGSNVPTTNYGYDATASIGYESATPFKRRILIKFTALDTVASTTQIDSVLIRFVSITETAALDSVEAYVIKRDWVETQATWNIYSTGNNWGTAGAFDSDDIYMTGADTTNGLQASADTHYVNITNCTRQVAGVDSAVSHRGFFIKATRESGVTQYRNFASSSNGTAANRPMIMVWSSIAPLPGAPDNPTLVVISDSSFILTFEDSQYDSGDVYYGLWDSTNGTWIQANGDTGALFYQPEIEWQDLELWRYRGNESVLFSLYAFQRADSLKSPPSIGTQSDYTYVKHGTVAVKDSLHFGWIDIDSLDFSLNANPPDSVSIQNSETGMYIDTNQTTSHERINRAPSDWVNRKLITTVNKVVAFVMRVMNSDRKESVNSDELLGSFTVTDGNPAVGMSTADYDSVGKMMADTALVYTQVDGFSPDSIILYLPFDCNTDDYSGEGNHAINYGATRRTQYDSVLKGLGSYSFDGINDYMLVANESAFDDTGDFFVGGWILPTSTGTNQFIITKRADNSHIAPFFIHFNGGNGSLNFIMGEGSSVAAATTTITLNKKVHIMGGIIDTTLYLYVNGILIDTDPFEGARQQNNTPITIGVNGGVKTGTYFGGIIDEMFYIEKGLSITEIQNIYRHGEIANLQFADNQIYKAMADSLRYVKLTIDDALIKTNGVSISDFFDDPVRRIQVKWDTLEAVVNMNYCMILPGSIFINAADISTPTTYFVYINSAGAVTVSTSDPTYLNHAMICELRISSISGIATYYWIRTQVAQSDGFIEGTFHRTRHRFPDYIEPGFRMVVNTGTGAIDTVIAGSTHVAVHHVGFDSLISPDSLLLDDESYIHSLEDITTYAGGETITDNKYVKFLIGAIVTGGDSAKAKIMVVRQAKPTIEYKTSGEAAIDKENMAAQSFGVPYNGEVLPIYFYIMKKGDASDFVQIDLRGAGDFGGGGLGGGISEATVADMISDSIITVRPDTTIIVTTRDTTRRPHKRGMYKINVDTTGAGAGIH